MEPSKTTTTKKYEFGFPCFLNKKNYAESNAVYTGIFTSINLKVLTKNVKKNTLDVRNFSIFTASMIPISDLCDNKKFMN